MQRSIDTSKAMMWQMMDWKIQAVHKHLDAFELRVLESLAPAIDVSTFQMELASLCADVVALLAPSEPAPEETPVAEEDDVVMTALLVNSMPPPDSFCAIGKHPRYD